MRRLLAPFFAMTLSGCVLVVDFDDYQLGAGGAGGQGGGQGGQGGGGAAPGGGGAGGNNGGGGEAPCAGVSFDTNPDHCGGCDHACDGADCVGGLCTPQVLGLEITSDPAEPRAMIANETSVYVSVDTAPGAGDMVHIVRVDAAELAQTAESVRVVTALPFSMAIVGDAVLMTGQYTGLTSCNLGLDSCATEGTSLLNGIIQDPTRASRAFVLDYSTTSLQAYDGEAFTLQWDTDTFYGNSVAANSHRLAMSLCQSSDCSGDGSVCTILLEDLPVGETAPDCPVAGPSGNILAAGPVALHEDDTLYYVHDNALGRVRADQKTTLLTDAVNIAVDDRFLYVLRAGSLAFCANEGDCSSLVAFPDIPADTSYGLTQNDRYIFFGAGTSLYRVRKPAPEWEAESQ